jgi:hypothetical protein
MKMSGSQSFNDISSNKKTFKFLCHPKINEIKNDNKIEIAESSKLEILTNYIEKFKKKKEKLIIFSSNTSLFTLLGDFFVNDEIIDENEFSILSGDSINRTKIVDEFKKFIFFVIC